MKDIIRTEYKTYMEMYVRKLKENGVDKNSISNRSSAIKKFFDYLCDFSSKPSFETIKRVHIENYLTTRKENGAKGSTLKNVFFYLKDFFGFCKDMNYNTNKIFEDWNNGIGNDTKKEYLSEEQILDLNKIISTYEKSEKSLRTEICFIILTYTGCTKYELCSLNIYENIEKKQISPDKSPNFILLDEKEIYLGNKKSRMIPLSDYVVNKLKAYKDYLTSIHNINFEQYPFLFPSHYGLNDNSFKQINSSQINTGMKELVNSCDSIKAKGALFHMFRNTFIKNMINDGVPVQIIQELSGLTSLSEYVDNIEQYERDLKEKVLNEKHPYKVLYS